MTSQNVRQLIKQELRRIFLHSTTKFENPLMNKENIWLRTFNLKTYSRKEFVMICSHLRLVLSYQQKPLPLTVEALEPSGREKNRACSTNVSSIQKLDLIASRAKSASRTPYPTTPIRPDHEFVPPLGINNAFEFVILTQTWFCGWQWASHFPFSHWSTRHGGRLPALVMSLPAF